MSEKSSTELAIGRIAHVKSHLTTGFKIDQLIRNIENNLGNSRASVMSLTRHAEASAIYAWFGDQDLEATRQWFYVASKLDQYSYRLEVDKLSPGAKMLQLMKPLVSNNRPLIEWFVSHEEAYDSRRIENHRTHDFWAYQAIVALRGEWERLTERCQRIFSDPPSVAGEQKYLLDYQFYEALARRDTGKMTEVLEALVKPKAIRARVNDDSGYATDLISTAAVIYAKIAWYHGCDVLVDTPYIPAEWLSMEPLVRYDNRYSFLT